MWLSHDCEAINMYSEKVICKNYIGKAIGRQKSLKLINHWFNAFSNIKIKLNELIEHNNIIRATWGGTVKHTNVFCNLTPSKKTIEYAGCTFYKVRNNLISEVYSESNIKLNIIKQYGTSYLGFNRDTNIAIITKNSNYELLSEINVTCNSNLTIKEILVVRLWLSGYSLKESSRLMNLSSRTIEEYRSNVKNKLNVQNKKYLYDLLIHNETLNLFFNATIKQIPDLAATNNY